MEIKKCPFCGGIGELTMDEKIEIDEKAVRKSAEQESAFVDMLNQEVKELQENMEIVNLENELSNIQTYSYMEIYPCRQKQSNRIVAEHLIMKGYRKESRKESDTAKEILTELKNTRFHKGTLTYDFEMALNKIAEKYGVDLGE